MAQLSRSDQLDKGADICHQIIGSYREVTLILAVSFYRRKLQ